MGANVDISCAGLSKAFQVFFDVEHDDKEFHDFAFRKKFLR